MWIMTEESLASILDVPEVRNGEEAFWLMDDGA